MILGENKDHRPIRIYHLGTGGNSVISSEEKGIPSFGIRAGIAGRVGFDCLEHTDERKPINDRFAGYF